MLTSHDLRILIVGVLTSIPAILLSLAALWRVVRGESRIATVERVVNGERDAHHRRLVQDAWDAGRRAGIAEHEALHTFPPTAPRRELLPPG